MESIINVSLSVPELEKLVREQVKLALVESEKLDEKSGIKFLTFDETVDFLQIAKQTLYQLTSSKKIPCIKRGRRLYFLQGDLVRWMQEHKK